MPLCKTMKGEDVEKSMKRGEDRAKVLFLKITVAMPLGAVVKINLELLNHRLKE